MSSTSSFTPCAAWNLPLLQLVSLASVSIATVQAPTSQLGPSLRLGVTLLVPCPLCIPAKPHLPLSRSGTDVNIMTMLLSMWVPHAAGVLQTRANEGEVGLTFNFFWEGVNSRKGQETNQKCRNLVALATAKNYAKA